MTKFKIGDRVAYQGANRALHGLAGTVEKTGERYDGKPMTWARFDDGKLRGVINERLASLAPCDRNRGPAHSAFVNCDFAELERRALAYDGCVTGRFSHKAPNPEPVEVRDSGNHGRLLGHLRHRPVSRLQGGRLEVALPFRMSAADFDPSVSPAAVPALPRVTFDVSFRASPCGWERTVFLATSAPLDDLLRIETFRLPGETDREADTRRMRSRA